MAKLGLAPGQIRELQGKPAADIVKAAGELETEGRGSGRRGFVPTARTVDLPEQPETAIANGSAKVPLLTGCTEHEAALQLARGGAGLSSLTHKQVDAQIGGMFGTKAEDLLAGYRANHPDYSPADLLIRIMSDRTRIGSIRLAEAHIRGGGVPTFAYMFNWQSPVLPHLKAAHGIDGTFYFDNTETVDIAKGSPQARTLAQRASTAWTNFARSGNPNASGLPPWPEYTLEQREVMLPNEQPRVVADPFGPDRVLRQRLNV